MKPPGKLGNSRLGSVSQGRRRDATGGTAVPAARSDESDWGSLPTVLDQRSFMRHPFDPDAGTLAQKIPLLIGNAATETTLFLARDPRNFSLAAPEVQGRIERLSKLGQGLCECADRCVPFGVTGEVTQRVVGADKYGLYVPPQHCRNLPARQAASASAPVYAYVFDWCTPVMGGVLQNATYR